MTRSSLNGLQNRPPSKILQTNFYLKQENWNLGGTWLLDIQKVCRIECFLKMDLLWLLCKPLYTVRLILQWVFCVVVDEHQYSQLPSFQDIYPRRASLIYHNCNKLLLAEYKTLSIRSCNAEKTHLQFRKTNIIYRNWKPLLKKFILRRGFRKKRVGFLIEVTLNNAGYLVS